jgi:hypothetical protein
VGRVLDPAQPTALTPTALTPTALTPTALIVTVLIVTVLGLMGGLARLRARRYGAPGLPSASGARILGVRARDRSSPSEL